MKILPDSFEIRRIRVSSFVYLPFQYYPNAPGIIEDDINFIINKLSNGKRMLLEYYSENDINYYLNEVYFIKGAFYIRIDKKEKAMDCLDKISKDSTYHKKLSDYINENNKGKS